MLFVSFFYTNVFHFLDSPQLFHCLYYCKLSFFFEISLVSYYIWISDFVIFFYSNLRLPSTLTDSSHLFLCLSHEISLLSVKASASTFCTSKFFFTSFHIFCFPISVFPLSPSTSFLSTDHILPPSLASTLFLFPPTFRSLPLCSSGF